MNLVEVDLTRAGQRELLAQRWVGVPGHASTYQASVWRPAQPGRVGLYARHLHEALPVIRIPLCTADPDTVLDLQSLVTAAYAASRFDRTIDHPQPCVPPLEGTETAWAAQRLTSAK